MSRAEAAEGFFRGEYYFAYDSYMDQGQATTRLTWAMLMSQAVLRNYRGLSKTLFESFAMSCWFPVTGSETNVMRP